MCRHNPALPASQPTFSRCCARAIRPLRRFSLLRTRCGLEYVVESPCRVQLDRRHDVAVGIERDRHRGVPEALRDDLWVHVSPRHLAGVVARADRPSRASRPPNGHHWAITSRARAPPPPGGAPQLAVTYGLRGWPRAESNCRHLDFQSPAATVHGRPLRPYTYVPKYLAPAEIPPTSTANANVRRLGHHLAIRFGASRTGPYWARRAGRSAGRETESSIPRGSGHFVRDRMSKKQAQVIRSIYARYFQPATRRP